MYNQFILHDVDLSREYSIIWLSMVDWSWYVGDMYSADVAEIAFSA